MLIYVGRVVRIFLYFSGLPKKQEKHGFSLDRSRIKELFVEDCECMFCLYDGK